MIGCVSLLTPDELFVFVQRGSVNPRVSWWRGRLRLPEAGNFTPPGINQGSYMTSDLLLSDNICICYPSCSPVLKVNVDLLHSSPLLSSQEPPHGNKPHTHTHTVDDVSSSCMKTPSRIKIQRHCVRNVLLEEA